MYTTVLPKMSTRFNINNIFFCGAVRRDLGFRCENSNRSLHGFFNAVFIESQWSAVRVQHRMKDQYSDKNTKSLSITVKNGLCSNFCRAKLRKLWFYWIIGSGRCLITDVSPFLIYGICSASLFSTSFWISFSRRQPWKSTNHDFYYLVSLKWHRIKLLTGLNTVEH